MTYQELIDQAQHYAADGSVEGMQKAHDLLWNQDKSGYTEIERDRIWDKISNLREDIWDRMGLPPVALGDEDLQGLRTVDPERY